MNEMQVFTNPEFGEIRTLEINGEPWLVGKDVATALGYSNTKKALIDHVDAEDKQQGDGVTIRDPMGRIQRPTIINESGLYSLILSSKLPSAKKFKRWVTSEVLPAIRKTGMYTMPSVNSQVSPAPVEQRTLTTDDYITAARLISDCRNERLPYVIGCLEQVGFIIPKLKEIHQDRPTFKLKVEKTFINLEDFL